MELLGDFCELFPENLDLLNFRVFVADRHVRDVGGHARISESLHGFLEIGVTRIQAGDLA